MKVEFVKEAKDVDVALVVGVFEDNKLSDAAKILDDTTKGVLKKALKHSHFKGKTSQTLSLIAPNDLKVNRIVLLGLGKEADLTPRVAQEIGAAAYKAVCCTPDTHLVFHIDTLSNKKHKSGELAAYMAFGCVLKSWRFDAYRTKDKPEDKPALKTATFIVEDIAGAKDVFKHLEALSKGIFLCRDLGTEPSNILTPPTYAKRIQDEFKGLGVDVEVLDVPAMKKLGMGALLGVGQGSENEPRLVVMKYNGGNKKDQPVAFVGKGVTFDSGGISIKPAQGMEEMKFDMCGSAAVVGLLKTLALRKAKVNAVGVVGLVENMPSGNAQRPGDIVKSMSGQTIQVENTDAEGRLVLADALWYTQDRFKPQFMVNLATLTGAIVISLGDIYAGLFSNNDELAKRLYDMGEKTGELVWRMPMADAYDKQLNIPVADMNNIGGRKAGSITAAQFLKRFVNDVPWAHLDIAGTAYMTDREPTLGWRGGGTGMGVYLLDQLVHAYYEA